MPDYHAQLVRIKAKLPLAREADPQLKVFGANGHKYHTAGPVPENHLRTLEQQYGIELPADYRQFLREIGPGAGPFYGLYAPGSHLGMLDTTPAVALPRPSPLRPRLSAAEWTVLTQPFEDDDMSDADYQLETDRLFAGIWPLGTQGCSYYHGLLLHGEHRGRVVNLDVERGQPKFAYEANFLDWYERWLDEVINGTLLRDGPSWFGYQRGGTEAELLAGYRAAPNPTEQEEYLIGLARLPAASTATAQVLAAACASTYPAVARQALAMLTKFDYQQARPRLKSLWPGDSLLVYKLLNWYAKPYAEEWVAELQATFALPDPHQELFSFATYVAQECTTDLSAAIQPWLKHPKLGAQAEYTLREIAGKRRLWERVRPGK